MEAADRVVLDIATVEGAPVNGPGGQVELGKSCRDRVVTLHVNNPEMCLAVCWGGGGRLTRKRGRGSGV